MRSILFTSMQKIKDAISQKLRYPCNSSAHSFCPGINSAVMDYLALFLSALEIPAFAQMKPGRNVVALASFKSVSTSHS